MRVEAWQHRLRAPLLPLGVAYGLAMRLRRALVRPFNPPVPTVSVGNIAWGGTGKTPVTEYLLRWCADAGLRPCVLTRGYGAHPASLPCLVDPEHSLAAECGDEPLQLAKNNRNARVLVDPVRVRAAQAAMAWNPPPDIFIMDDGFQHIRLGRHINLVLLRREDVFGEYGRVIPSGQWREGAGALRHADAFLMKIDSVYDESLQQKVVERLQPFGRPFFPFFIAADVLRPVGRHRAAALPKAGAWLLVTGTGRPRQVRQTASAALHGEPADHLIFPDHHAYTEADARRIAAYGLPVVCTSKDADKLAPWGLDLWEMPITVRFGKGMWCSTSFDTWFEARLTRCRNQMRP